jgi:hypothetical protein
MSEAACRLCLPRLRRSDMRRNWIMDQSEVVAATLIAQQMSLRRTAVGRSYK